MSKDNERLIVYLEKRFKGLENIPHAPHKEAEEIVYRPHIVNQR